MAMMADDEDFRTKGFIGIPYTRGRIVVFVELA
jgi:hypothetical protein